MGTSEGDAHEIWCHDSDWGTSLGGSIPCPPVLCSVRKIHLRPQVLRPTSSRNISPISNPNIFNPWMWNSQIWRMDYRYKLVSASDAEQNECKIT
ncbi:embryonic stem cell-related gene protein-like isoform X2 [Pan paniscus]|uniref:embryonic stem cell-related gene protein-like isoform X2 n=1 Tax=Pan paniscus TaxID=9597 RepID=UPI0024370C6A|nr:embryonic stem cell-related gene protein-like isoform X2 [Pan paniscus]